MANHYEVMGYLKIGMGKSEDAILVACLDAMWG